MATVKTTKPTYKDMIISAVTNLKERNGSSRQALKKYIQTKFDVNTTNFDSQFNMAIKRGVSSDSFVQPKGPSGPVKLNKAVVGTKKITAIKKAASKKKPAPKKAAAAAKKSAPKKKVSTKAPKKAVGTKQSATSKKSNSKSKPVKKTAAKKVSKKTKKAPKRK
ncbi:hypothetical protein FOA43_001212 [Brettanomyces nanus]|uniref:Histone H1 n=1 Tax=Eeniella nana TaxID=13502 RepID=A0A875RTV6_EENNA|nr:uncharacterized protein FOA43_001212 [Brettanomyces nanus]QPG73897.1 hypothetical protein FOA43_001212 [Brettanomyces nanus]